MIRTGLLALLLSGCWGDPPPVGGDTADHCVAGARSDAKEYAVDRFTVALYHLNELDNTATACDASDYQYHATLEGDDGEIVEQGAFGHGWRFSHGAHLATPPGVVRGDAWTLETWFRLEGSSATLFSVGAGTDHEFRLEVLPGEDVPDAVFQQPVLMMTWNIDGGYDRTHTPMGDPQDFHHLTLIQEDDYLNLYLNPNEDDAPTRMWRRPQAELGDVLLMGGDGLHTSDNQVVLDELRISSTARDLEMLVDTLD